MTVYISLTVLFYSERSSQQTRLEEVSMSQPAKSPHLRVEPLGIFM